MTNEKKLLHAFTLACLVLSCRSLPADDHAIASHLVFGGHIHIPAPENIESISVSLFNSPLGLEQLSPIPIPKEDVPKVMAMFYECDVDGTPVKIVKEVGSVRIETKKGEVLNISILWLGGKTRLRMCVQGVLCARSVEKWEQGVDDAMAFELTIRGIYRRETGIDTFTAKPE